VGLLHEFIYIGRKEMHPERIKREQILPRPSVRQLSRIYTLPKMLVEQQFGCGSHNVAIDFIVGLTAYGDTENA
jgi:hypothetical protein